MQPSTCSRRGTKQSTIFLPKTRISNWGACRSGKYADELTAAGKTLDPALFGELRILERTWQISAGDEAMAALHHEKLYSAYAVGQLGETAFMRKMAGRNIPEPVARQCFFMAELIRGITRQLLRHHASYRPIRCLCSFPAAPRRISRRRSIPGAGAARRPA